MAKKVEREEREEARDEEVKGGAKKVKKSGSKTTKKVSSKTTKKPAKKVGKKKAKGGSAKNSRYFKMVNSKDMSTTGRYTGETPKQAASKGYTKLIQSYKKDGKAIPSKTNIFLRESTRGSNKKIYGYSASRVKLDKPQTLQIPDGKGDVKEITYHYRNKIKKIAIPEQMGGAMKKAKAKSKSKGKAVKKSGSKTTKKATGSKKPAKKTTGSKKPAKKTTKK
jgi:hypothetical protein